MVVDSVGGAGCLARQLPCDAGARDNFGVIVGGGGMVAGINERTGAGPAVLHVARSIRSSQLDAKAGDGAACREPCCV